MTVKKRITNPMSEYLLKLQLIVTNIEFMNKEEANRYETADTKINGTAYVNAVLKKDTFDSYDIEEGYLRRRLTELLDANSRDEFNRSVNPHLIRKYLMNPQFIPEDIKNIILEELRAVRIATYKEPNKYYLNLMGLPLETTDPEIPIPKGFYQLYANKGEIYQEQPIHTLPKKYQELLMNSDYYQELLTKYPNVDYLKHIGSYSIPLEISRKAKDGDILLLNTSKLQTYHETFGNVTVSSDIVHTFVTVYKKIQRYVYGTLRGDFSFIYPNYNSFIRFLTIYLTIGNCMNEFMHKSTKLIYMNNSIANDYFSLYGLPSVLMEGNSLVSFLKKFRLLLMDKGTNTVYRVKDLIGYNYTDIYTLVMVKQQAFKNGYPVYYKDPDTGEMKPKQDIVFRRMGTAEDNTSYFQFRNETKSYTVEEITSGDPRWWNTPEVERMIQNMNYTLSNSKYIQLSTAMSMDDIWWQTCILLRGLLDHRTETTYTKIGLSQSLNGTSNVSLYEATLLLIIIMTWNHVDFQSHHFSGTLHLPNSTFNGVAACVDMLFNGLNVDGSPKPLIPGTPYKVSSFNFDIRYDGNKYNVLSTYEYLEPSTFMSMLDQILDREDINVGGMIMSNVKLLYEYLATKLRTASTIHEFRQVTDAYNWLFLVDPVRDWATQNEANTNEMLRESYGLSTVELSAFKKYFYDNKESIVVNNYEGRLYQFYVYDLLNENVLTIPDAETTMFTNPNFVNAVNQAISQWTCLPLEESNLSNVVKANYQSILRDKILLDVSSSQYGPTSFEALLFRANPPLYRSLQEMKADPDELLILMRSIIRSLEIEVNHSLTALEFEATGKDEYIAILKEVITYFKSYMVEFTKSEFRYIFGGLFDNGGNSNMLLLFDEINHTALRMIPKDALHLYDVSCAKARLVVADDLSKMLYDEALFRIKTTYKKLKTLHYELWFDNGDWIDQQPFDDLTDDSVIIAEFLNDNSGTYKIIINKENVLN